jgi:tripartite-type tricarboxylate transporter receptor subunit TctC
MQLLIGARHAALAAIVVAGMAASQLAPAAASEADFFKSKTVTIIVPYPPGGGYDAYARLMANNLGRHIPGNPNFIVQNMPGAAAILAANHIARVAPKDGTSLIILPSSAAFATVFGNKAATYVATDFSWIGNLDVSTDLCAVSGKSGIKTFQDLLKAQTVFGATALSGIDSEYARAMNVLFGTRIKVVHGYSGSSSVTLAVQRGEVQGACNYVESALQSVYRDDYNAGRLVPIVQFGEKSKELKGIPYILDLARDQNERQVFNLIFNRVKLGRAIAAPPGLASERLNTLRAGFDALTKDPAFLDAAEKSKLPIHPQSGAEVEAFIKDMMSASPEVIARVHKALATGENEQLRSLDGSITSVQGNDLVVTDGAGKPHNLRISKAASKIIVTGQQADPDAIKPGMACTLRYISEGEVAETIACK